MHCEHCLLFDCLARHIAHLRARDRFADRVGVIAIILLLGPVGLDKLNRHQPYLMAKLLQFSSPVVRTPTRFNPNPTGRQLSKISQSFAPTQLFTNDDRAVGIYPVPLKHILGDIETNSGHLHGSLPLLSVSDVFSLP